MRIFFIVSLTILIFPFSAYGDKAASLNKKGIKAYKENRIDESINDFTDALIERPETPELNFNRGTALSSAGKNDEALEELGKAASAFSDPAKEASAQFNMGNTYANAKDIPAAIDQYKNSVKLDQTAKDYRHNLELLMKEKRKNEQQQQQNKDDKKNDDKDKEKSDSTDKNQNNQEQSKAPQQDSQNRQEMSAKEAKQLLDAIEDAEKKAFELRRKEIQNNTENSNDW